MTGADGTCGGTLIVYQVGLQPASAGVSCGTADNFDPMYVIRPLLPLCDPNQRTTKEVEDEIQQKMKSDLATP